MLMENREQVRTRMQTDGSYVRCYGKNRRFTGENLSAKLWIGDYSSAKEFTELASASQGIKRLAVLRADVDNLGQAFVAGFEGKNTSLSRTTTFPASCQSFLSSTLIIFCKIRSFLLERMLRSEGMLLSFIPAVTMCFL